MLRLYHVWAGEVEKLDDVVVDGGDNVHVHIARVVVKSEPGKKALKEHIHGL